MNSRLMVFARLPVFAGANTSLGFASLRGRFAALRAARNLLRGLAAATAVCWIAAPPEARALPLISEVFYDAVGTDDGLSFVELYGSPGTDLTGYVIQGINGTGGTVTDNIALSGVIPSDGLFVVADGLTDGTTQVQNADQIANFDFQNGPDSVVLSAGAAVFDAVGYGVFAASDVFAGEGQSQRRSRRGLFDRAPVRQCRHERQCERLRRRCADARQRVDRRCARAGHRGAAVLGSSGPSVARPTAPSALIPHGAAVPISSRRATAPARGAARAGAG
jgi:hypothetical protein